jgi:hypothetical protein
MKFKASPLLNVNGYRKKRVMQGEKHKRILERLKYNFWRLKSCPMFNFARRILNRVLMPDIKRRGEYMYMKNVNYNFN